MTDAAPGTIIVSRALHASTEARFEIWASRLNDVAAAANGYLSVLHLGQTNELQHLVYQFRNEGDAQAWYDSTGFRQLASEADGFSVGLEQLSAGNRVRFDLPSDASEAKWKRFVATWLAVLPMLLAVTSVMRWLLHGWPPALQLIPSSLILTAMLQWIVLPRVQRWGRYWLLEGANGKLRTK